jgi:Fe-Mn family superoxide dismutase
MAFELPDLPYAYDALEPSVDKQTMELHHDKHHATYVSKLNSAVEGTELANKALNELLQEVSKHPTGVRNNGGGHWNHAFFWQIMGPNGGNEPTGEFADLLNQTFSSFEDFKEQFANAAKGVFGSGWAWLVVNSNNQLQIGTTPNQDNPLMDVTNIEGTPVLGLDMWEHAFYLKYQNRKDEYIQNWYKVVNWDEVGRRCKAAMQ